MKYESGQLVNSRYSVCKCLYEGKACRVYSAIDQILQRLVAIKHFAVSSSEAVEEMIQQAMREATILASIDHPSIISIYDLYRSDEHLDFIMPLKPHQLSAINRETIFGNVSDLIYTLKQVATGLDHLSQLLISHRDIKPENILVDNIGNASIIDFGLSVNFSREQPPANTRGTYPYLGPEALIKDGEIPSFMHLYDQFSFGVSIYRILTGALPYQHLFKPSDPSSACTAYHLLRRETMPPCADFDSQIPKAVDDVMSRMLCINPEGRYPSNADAVSHLELALSGKLLNRSKLFISYSKHDVGITREVYDKLMNAGLEPWFDQNIRAGENWDDQIEMAMFDCDVMIVLLSRMSVQSGEVKNEWSYWISHLKKPLITVVIDDCQIPYRLFSRQHIVSDRSNVDLLIEQVIGALPQVLESFAIAQQVNRTDAGGIEYYSKVERDKTLRDSINLLSVSLARVSRSGVCSGEQIILPPTDWGDTYK